jgi:hypothetical protein
MLRYCFLVPVIWIVVLPMSLAQSVVGTASGSGVIGNQQTHAWSVGEMCAITTQTSPTLVVTQGFLQPSDAPVSTDEPAGLWVTDLLVFPNPTIQSVQISGTIGTTPMDIQMLLTDASGKSLWANALALAGGTSLNQQIDLSLYPSGQYMLTLSGTGKPLTYIITKI